MEELIKKVLSSREIAHILHLKATGEGSFAKHLALNEYYDGIVDLIDSLVETYQGQFGLLNFDDNIKVDNIEFKDTIKYFEELVSYVGKNRNLITSKAGHLNSQLDDIEGLLYRLLYKLKNLK